MSKDDGTKGLIVALFILVACLVIAAVEHNDRIKNQDKRIIQLEQALNIHSERK